MTRLTGRYEGSLWYLLATSLWMDLGEVLGAYRTLRNRVRSLKRASSDPSAVERLASHLEAGRLPELSSESVIDMADHILHTTWDPGGSPGRDLQLAWKGSDPKTVDFVEGDLRGLAEDTINQVGAFIDDAVTP